MYANARGPGCFDFDYYVQVWPGVMHLWVTGMGHDTAPNTHVRWFRGLRAGAPCQSRRVGRFAIVRPPCSGACPVFLPLQRNADLADKAGQHQQLWEHFVLLGQFQGRQHRWAVAALLLGCSGAVCGSPASGSLRLIMAHGLHGHAHLSWVLPSVCPPSMPPPSLPSLHSSLSALPPCPPFLPSLHAPPSALPPRLHAPQVQLPAADRQLLSPGLRESAGAALLRPQLLLHQQPGSGDCRAHQGCAARSGPLGPAAPSRVEICQGASRASMLGVRGRRLGERP